MNSKQDNLFVKRNADFNNRIYSDLEYNHNKTIHAISHTKDDPWVVNMTQIACDKISEKQDEEAFHNQLKPLLVVLRALGCFPVEFPASGVPTYRSLSPALAYSICLYVLLNGSAFFAIRHHYLLSFNKDRDLNDSIFTFMMIINLANCTCVPALAWLDTPKAIQYFKKWEQFQMMFANVTEEQLVLNIKRTYIYRIIVISILVTVMIPLKFLQPFLHYWHLLCCSVCFCVVSTAITTFSGVFQGLGTAATVLNKCFKQDMRKMIHSAQLIGKYRILWLRWSQLVSQIGCMLGKVFCLYLLLMLLSITVSLYGCLSRLKKQQAQFSTEMEIGGVCFFTVLALYHFCNCAHSFSNIVGIEIRNELQLIEPSEVSEEVSREVNKFVETIVTNPPVVSVAGFASVDRGLFRAYASTIVTYMIVLMQFEQSDHHSDMRSGNETLHL